MSKVALHEYLNEIQRLLNEESYGEAVSHCRSILRQYPRHVDTYRLLGQALLEQGDYEAAEDVFQRILGALPNDLTVHVGLSLIAQETDELPKAIWHMQRAYELDPYNPSLQSELKKLYKSRDGRTPAKLVLTQGALAHLHFRGEMYKTAVSEWQSMLKKEPNRLDIKAMLAEAYWRQNERVNAVELSRHLLEEAPNCIQANAIIAEIWLLTGRFNEAQPYLQLLQGLTQVSEATFEGETIVGRAFATKGAPALFKQILVEQGDGDDLVVKEETAVSSADWLSEVDIDSDDETGSSEWFTSGAAAATAVAAKESTGETGWLQDVEEDEANDTFDSFADALPTDEPPEFDDLFSDQDAQDTDQDNWFNSLTATETDELEAASNLPENDADDIFGTGGDTNLPDWMGDEEADSGSDVLDWFDGNETAVSDTPLVADDELDWLGELDSNTDSDLASDDLFGNTPTQADDDDDDHLFSGLGLSGILVGTAAAGVAATLYNDDDKEEGDDSLDWLSDDLEPLAEGSYKAAKEDADHENPFMSGTGLTGMLMANDDDSNDSESLFADELPSTDLPDWLGGEDENGEEETAVDNVDLPDWLNQSDDADTIVPAVDLPDWLNTGADETTGDTGATVNDLPDWLADSNTTDDQAESFGDAPLPDWLTASSEEDADDDISRAGIAAAGAVAGGAIIAAMQSDNDEDDQDEFADWLSDDLAPLTIEESDTDLSEDETLFGGPGLTAMLLGGEPQNNDNDDSPANSDENLPEWLSDDLSDLTDEPSASGKSTDIDSIDWLNESVEDASDITDTNYNDLPDWLSSDPTKEDDNDDTLQAGLTAGAVVVAGIAAATHDDNETQEEWEDTTMSNDDDNETGLPDELFADMPENEADALDWLDQLAEDQNLDAQDTIPAEKNLPTTNDELPDWLQDAPEPAGMMNDTLDFDSPEESDISADADIPDWLKTSSLDTSDEDDTSYASKIAAGEGDIFDEMPTQVSAPDPFIGDEDTAEFDALFADEADAPADDFNDLFADTDDSDLFSESDTEESSDFDALFSDGLDTLPEEMDDDIDLSEAASLGLSEASIITSLDDEPEADPLAFLEVDASDDDFGDLFADLDDVDDSFLDFDVEEVTEDVLSVESVENEASTIDEEPEEKEKFDPAGALAASALAAALAKRSKKKDIAPPPVEDENVDTFDDMFADVDSVEDPLADLDMLKKEAAEPLDFLADGMDDSDLDDLFGDMDADDPLDSLGLEEETAVSSIESDPLDFLADGMDDSDLDDLFGDMDASDPLDSLGLEEETAVSSIESDPLDFLADGMDDSDLDDLFGDMDADDPLVGLGLEEETAVSSIESDPLDFLADDMDDSDLDDSFDDVDADDSDDDTTNILAGLAGVAGVAAIATSLTDDADVDEESEEKDESPDLVDAITAFEEEGIDEGIFAEAGMGDSVSDSDIMDLSEGLEWLDDSIADTGELTAFDWMAEDAEDDVILAESPADVAEFDAVDDQISWLDELAAQQEDDLDEEVDTPSAAILAGGVAAGAIAADLLAGEPEDDEAEIDDAMSWLNDFSDEGSEPTEQLPSIADIVDLEPETGDEYKTPFFADAENALADDKIDSFDFDAESTSSELEDLDAEMARLEALAAEQEDELPADDVPPFATARTVSAVAETAVDIDDVLDDDLDDAMSWLDDLDSQPMIETAVETPEIIEVVEDAIIEEEFEIQPEPIDLAIADEAELDDDLDDAMAWLDDLEKDDDPVIELKDVASVAAVAGGAALIADKLSDDDADEKEEPVAPTRLSRALDWLESLAVTKGVVLTETAVDIDVSDDELAQALDGLDALAATPSTTSDNDDARDDELWVERPDPEVAEESVIQDEYTDYAVETSEGLVVWKNPDDDDAVDLGVDLDFSDMFDGLDLDDENDDLADTDDTKNIDLDLDFDIPDDPDEMVASIEATAKDEYTDYAVETSEGLVVWRNPDDDDAVDLGVDLDFSDMFDDFDDDDMDGLFTDDDGGTDPKVSAPTATKSGEELHAQQIDTESSVAPPSFNIDLDDGVPVTLPEDPDDQVAWLDGASDEQDSEEFTTFDTSPIDDILGDSDIPTKENDEPLFGEEMGLGHDLSDSMPEWLSFTGGSNDDADWLSALPEADVSGWLEAEGDVADNMGADWEAVNAPRGQSRTNKPASPRPQPQRAAQTEDLRLPETSMLSPGFSIDGEKLRNARRMVNSGDTQASVTAYRTLIQEGDGLNIIISDLEVATQKFNNAPQIRHLLGDAYTQNGQLQKALDTYRGALGMM